MLWPLPRSPSAPIYGKPRREILPDMNAPRLLSFPLIIAFSLPNMFRRFFAEGAFSQGFVPVMARYREKYSHEDAREFVERPEHPAAEGQPPLQDLVDVAVHAGLAVTRELQ